MTSYFAFLVQAAQDFLQADNPCRILDARYPELADLIDLAGYEWYGSGQRQLVLTASRGIIDSVEGQDRQPDSTPGQMIISEAAQLRQPILHRSIQSLSDESTAPLRKLGMTGYLCFPMIQGWTLFGVVSFATRRAGGWQDEALVLLQTVSLYCATALASRVSYHGDERRVSQDTQGLQQSLIKLRSMAAAHLLAEQQTRRQIARDLKNHLVHRLAHGRMKLGHVIRQTTTASTNALLHDVDDVIDQAVKFTETFAGQLTPEVLPEQGFQPALQWLALQLKKDGLAVTLHLPSLPPVLNKHDAIFLFQSVQELLLNVLKHAGTKRATVSVAQEPTGHVRVSVEDAGKGFIIDDLEQTPDPHSRFGLFRIKEWMTLLQGRMHIHTLPDQGTRVTLTVPSASAVITDSPDSEPVRPERLRVLLVDDHAMVREGLRSILEGYQDLEVIGEAGDGIEAVKLARTRHPDVVVMDINMPRLDGVAATRQIKQDHPATAVIGISIQDSSQVEQAMISAGATTFLRKDRAASHLHDAIVQAR